MDFEEIAAHFGYSLGIGAIPVKRFSCRAGSAKDAMAGKVDKDIVLLERRLRHFVPKLSAPDRKDRRKTGGADPELSNAAIAQAGTLQQRQSRGTSRSRLLLTRISRHPSAAIRI